MKRVFGIFLLMFVLGQEAHSQTAQIDSLRQALDTANGETLCSLLVNITDWQINYDLDSVEKYARLALECPESNNNYVLKVRPYCSLGYAYEYWKQPNEALIAFRNAEEIALVNQDSMWLSDIYCGFGTTYRQLYDYDNAQRCFKLGIMYGKAENHTWFVAKNMNNLASVFSLRGENELMLRTYLEIMEVLTKGNAFVGNAVPIMHNNVGVGYRMVEKYDSALVHFEKARKGYKKYGYADLEALTLGNMTYCYAFLGKSKKAQQSFDESEELATSKEDNANKLFRYESVTELYIRTGQYQKAIEYANKILEVVKVDTAVKESEIKAYEFLYRANEGQGEFRDALKYYKISDSLGQALRDRVSSKEVQTMRAAFETEMNFAQQERALREAELNEEIQRKEAEKQKSWRNFLIALSVLGFLLSVLVVNRFKLRAKAARSKKEQLELEKENLQLQIEHKNRELTSTSMFVAQKNQLLMDLQEHLKEFKGVQDDGVQKQLRNLRNEIKSNIHLEEDWEKVKLHFEEVYPSFFKNLNRKFPDLTNLELKHCAYLKMNLSVKEVARMLSVAPKSVQMSHYRLKKKLKLTSEQSLSTFLDQI